jgi:uncharacterized delta-60 repeat protein
MAVNSSPTFNAGKVIAPIGGNDWTYARESVVQSDGKVIVIGSTRHFPTTLNFTSNEYNAVRFNLDGSIDTSYGQNGVVNSSTVNIVEIANAAAIQADGKLIIAGSSGNSIVNGFLETKFALYRLNTDGSLDTSFNSNGSVLTAINAPLPPSVASASNGAPLNDVVKAIAIQADGKIIAAGSSGVNYNVSGSQARYSDFALARYNADGSLDTSFDADGKTTTSFSTRSEINSIKLLANGQILATGFVRSTDAINEFEADFVLVKYNSNGSLDTSFGVNGKLVSTEFTPLQYASGFAESILFQTDGKIILVGTINNGGPGIGGNFALARYNANGTVDTSFGVDGLVNIPFPYDEFIVGGSLGVIAENAIMQPDGKIIVVGYNPGGGKENYAIARYNTDGTLDNSFGTKGVVRTDVGDSDRYSSANGDHARSVNLLADGKILVSGDAHPISSPSGFAIVKYNSDGSIDNIYGESSLTRQLSYHKSNLQLNYTPFDESVKIYDPELAALNNGEGNYSGSSITLSRHGGANSEDKFSDSSSFYGLGGATKPENGDVLVDFGFSSINIGAFTNTNGTLTINFNENATQQRVNEILSRLTYANTSDEHVLTGAVQIDWVFNDGNTGAQGTGGAKSVVSSTTIDVFATNFPTVVTSPIADQSYLLGTTVDFTLPSDTFYDADFDNLTYSITLSNGDPLPSWLTFNAATGKFYGTPTQVGNLSISVTATDPFNSSATDDFNLNITTNYAPVVSSFIPDQIANADTLFSSTLPVNTFTDANGDALTYTATLSNGNALPSWLVFNSATKTFTGTPPQSAAGILSIRVTATDQFSLLAFDDFNLNIKTNHAPVVNSFLADKNAASGALFNYTLPADTFTDLDNDYLTYNATLSDGSALPSWLNFNAATKTFSGTPSQLGAFDIRITATDTSFASTSDSFLLNVTASIVPLVLNGRRGKDVLVGNAGNDIISGAAGNDSLYGNDGNDRITGGDGNDFMDGGAGADIMIGGKGSDIYIVDHVGDFISETSKSGGTDSVYSSVSFNLGANLENLVLTGSSNSNGIGNGLKNSIYGNSGSNYIDAGAGVDKLYGGAGDDTYVVDFIRKGSSAAKRYVTLQDSINEGANEGSDTLIVRGQFVLSKATTLYLDGNLENLDASGTGSTKLNLIGNANSNKLTGNAADNSLDGGSNNDFLTGGLGNDTLTGGVGADTFVWNLSDKGNNANPFIDKVTDFNSFEDKLDLRDLLVGETSSSILNFLDITTSNTSGLINTEIRVSTNGGFVGGEFSAASENQHITLSGVNLLSGTNEADLLASLMTQNKLVIDV